jgi:hypothetical protein
MEESMDHAEMHDGALLDTIAHELYMDKVFPISAEKLREYVSILVSLLREAQLNLASQTNPATTCSDTGESCADGEHSEEAVPRLLEAARSEVVRIKGLLDKTRAELEGSEMARSLLESSLAASEEDALEARRLCDEAVHELGICVKDRDRLQADVENWQGVSAQAQARLVAIGEQLEESHEMNKSLDLSRDMNKKLQRKTDALQRELVQSATVRASLQDEIKRIKAELETEREKRQDAQKEARDLNEEILELRMETQDLDKEIHVLNRKLFNSKCVRKAGEEEFAKIKKRFYNFSKLMHDSFAMLEMVSSEDAEAAEAAEKEEVSEVSEVSEDTVNSTVQQVLDEEEVYVLVDHSNLFHGCRMELEENGKQRKNLDIFIQREEFLHVIMAQRKAYEKHVFGSADDRTAAKHLMEAWKALDFQVHIEARVPGSPEHYVDDLLAGEINNRVAKAASWKENRNKTFVVVTGDGQENYGRPSIYGAVGNALSRGWKVELWSWMQCRSTRYQAFAEQYPDSMYIFNLDDHRKKITTIRKKKGPANPRAYVPQPVFSVFQSSKHPKKRPLTIKFPGY